MNTNNQFIGTLNNIDIISKAVVDVICDQQQQLQLQQQNQYCTMSSNNPFILPPIRTELTTSNIDNIFATSTSATPTTCHQIQQTVNNRINNQINNHIQSHLQQMNVNQYQIQQPQTSIIYTTMPSSHIHDSNMNNDFPTQIIIHPLPMTPPILISTNTNTNTNTIPSGNTSITNHNTFNVLSSSNVSISNIARDTESGTNSEHKNNNDISRKFECVHCKRCFPQHSNLINHLRVHTGEKPFECTICGKAFKQKNNLTRHIRIHTGEKPYKCEYCGRGFKQSCSLKMHQRIHTGEKPIKCQLCHKQFRHHNSLRHHMMTRHQ